MLADQDIGESGARLRYVDAQTEEIDLRIERRTDTVTQVRFELGSSASLRFASVLGRQFVDELNDADAFLVDWTVKEIAKREAL